MKCNMLDGFLKLASKTTKNCAGCELDCSLDNFYNEQNLDIRHNLDEFSQKFDKITILCYNCCIMSGELED